MATPITKREEETILLAFEILTKKGYIDWSKWVHGLAAEVTLLLEQADDSEYIRFSIGMYDEGGTEISSHADRLWDEGKVHGKKSA